MKNLNPLLRIAVIAGVDSAVKLHIQRGDNLDGQDRKGRTALMLAVSRRRKSIVRLLLAAGANPTLYDSTGLDALAYAEKGGCPTCLLLILEAKDKYIKSKKAESKNINHYFMSLEKEKKYSNRFVFLDSKKNITMPVFDDDVLKKQHSIKFENKSPSINDRRKLLSEEKAAKGGSKKWEGIYFTQVLSDGCRNFFKSNGVAVKSSGIDFLGIRKEGDVLIESCSYDKNNISAVNDFAVEKYKSQDNVMLEYDCLDLDFDSDWEEEQEDAAPVGDETVTEQARLLNEDIGKHKTINTDEEWSDIRLFLPRRSMPLGCYDLKRGSVSELLFIALREGSVSAHALVDACLHKDGLRDLEAERRLSFVIGELGALIESESAADKLPFLDAPTEDEEYELAAAIEFSDDLASGWNVPMRFYIKEISKNLLTAEEEIKLARIMEESTKDALEALAFLPTGLNALFNAAAQVERGEADVEMFSTGPDPADEDELGAELADIDIDERGNSLEPAELLFISAVSEAKSAGNNFIKVHESILKAKISRGFLIELSEMLKDDVSAELFVSAIQRQIAAREKMILSNLRLVISVAKRFSWSKLPLEDLLQEGNIGLIKAVERFDWRKGFRFSTYAIWWIRQHISRSIANNDRVVRAPIHIQVAAKSLLDKRDEIVAKTGHSVTEKELSIESGISLVKVRLLLSVFEDVISLDEVEEFIKNPVIDFLHCRENYHPESIAEYLSLQKALAEIIKTLDAKSAHVITMRFGLGGVDPLTLEEVGLYFDVTRERIRQIESKALSRLSNPNKSEKLEASLRQAGPFFSER